MTAARDRDRRALPARRRDRPGRHVDRLPRVRHGARAARRDQADAPRDRRRLRPARALPPRGALGGAAQPPARGHRDRRRRGALARGWATARAPGDARERRRTSCSSTSTARRSRTSIRREGPLEIPQAIAYAIEIARALGAAHERQIVHRDVKPHNVLDQRGRRRQDHRLRDRAHAHRGRADDGRARARHDRLRLARAGARAARHRPVGPVLAGRRAVRDAHRRGPVPRRARRWRSR